MPLKSPKWLATQHPDQIIIVDCRYNLMQPEQASLDYAHAHIPGAHFLDLESDLCAPKGQHGGRHPLPSADQFASVLSQLGWTPDKTLVAYDSDGSGAAHFWWLARYFGIDKDVVIVQGGFQAWLNAGLPVTADIPQPQLSPRPTLTPRSQWVVNRDFVLEHLGRYPLIDSRSYERYMGYYEPIDPVAGRIPGAHHFDYKAVYLSPAEYRPLESLQQHFAPVLSMQLPPIVYCGSGVSACSNIFALSLLGIPALLYAGSFSDWITYPDSPIEQGD
ncbi:MAG: sulfurtransferase [Sulfobacillus thermosulfidooxidans]|uniref:Sulfurtransferase n=1 Tax=Sulfobacillus thermosulfidooxidans TaxID=28034 RepID=A0A2T2WZ09_SULTH|nr:MAG: sulfurtransferase [Sulfobacillus thermosulfidooxidans]